jgi:hypothetical protein
MGYECNESRFNKMRADSGVVTDRSALLHCRSGGSEGKQNIVQDYLEGHNTRVASVFLAEQQIEKHQTGAHVASCGIISFRSGLHH